MPGVLSEQRFNEIKRIHRKMSYYPNRDDTESLVATVAAFQFVFGPLPPEYVGSEGQHSVTLNSVQAGHKIQVIKAVRQNLKVGLKVAKMMVDEVYDGPPLLLAAGLTWDEAHEFGRALESAGATATIL